MYSKNVNNIRWLLSTIDLNKLWFMVNASLILQGSGTMMDKMMNWAIFGAASFVWAYTLMRASGEGHSPELIMVVVSLITMSLMNGKTSGDNGIAHIIDGLKGCVPMIIGWVVASIVHDLISGLVYTQTVDPMLIGKLAIDVVVIVIGSVVMFSSVNALRD